MLSLVMSDHWCEKEWIGRNAETALFMTSGSGGCSDCDDDRCVIDLDGTRSIPLERLPVG